MRRRITGEMFLGATPAKPLPVWAYWALVLVTLVAARVLLWAFEMAAGK